MTSNAVNITDDGLAIFDSTTGDFSAVELTTKGDTLGYTGAVYQALGVGTDADTMVCDSSAATGVNFDTKSAGSSVILLSSQTASSSATIDFTTPFDDTTYGYYLFTYTNVRPATDAVELRVRFSVDGGSSFLTSDYRWVRLRISSSSGSTSIGENDSDSKIKMVVDLGNAAQEGLAGKGLYIPSNNPGEINAGSFIHNNSYVRNDGTYYRNIGTGMNETSSVVNGLRFYMDSGNIASGVFKMYGVEKA